MVRSIPPARFTLITAQAPDDLSEFAREVADGLTASPKRLPCRFFYDQEGSLLFEAICRLPEYYLTRAEQEILLSCATDIASLFSGNPTLVELGSGSATKTRLLIKAFLHRYGAVRYVPVDISHTMLEESARALLKEYPGLEITAIAGDYDAGLRQLSLVAANPKLILWLGSNIGNFERPEAVQFLRRLLATMSPADRLLVGIDLRKDRETLERAYDDAQGVTAQFNLNILARINRQLSGHFDLSAFGHRAVYNEEVGRIEMYLVSTRRQRVSIDCLNLEIPFEAGETIHTENSYKYSLSEINVLATAAGLRLERQWLDTEGHFSENLLAPVAEGSGQAQPS